MLAQYIKIGNRKWNVLVYYRVQPENFDEIELSLQAIGCPERSIDNIFDVLSHKNTGITFSNSDYMMSIVCIADTTSAGEFVNTAVHEAKHVQSHICAYYDIDEDGEDAAYLIGYIVHKMYKAVAKVLRDYVRFIGK